MEIEQSYEIHDEMQEEENKTTDNNDYNPMKN